MFYLYLVLAIVLECSGTFCMKLSDGFSQALPAVACLALYAGCFWAFSKVLQGISLSVAYATWSALGIVLATAIYQQRLMTSTQCLACSLQQAQGPSSASRREAAAMRVPSSC